MQTKKNSSTPFRICIFLFLSYSFGIETINTFIRSHSSLENHTRFQTKLGKISRFQTKTAQKPYSLGQQIPTVYGSCKGVPPGNRVWSKELNHVMRPTAYRINFKLFSVPKWYNVWRCFLKPHAVKHTLHDLCVHGIMYYSTKSMQNTFTSDKTHHNLKTACNKFFARK